VRNFLSVPVLEDGRKRKSLDVLSRRLSKGQDVNPIVFLRPNEEVERFLVLRRY